MVHNIKQCSTPVHYLLLKNELSMKWKATFSLLKQTADFLQYYYKKIQQILKFLINLYCLKAYHRPDNAICMKIFIIPKPNIFTETRTQDNSWICHLSSCNLLAETNNFVLCTILSCLVSQLPSLAIEPRTVFQGCDLCLCNLLSEINNSVLGTVLLSCIVT
jgi:hypothetical protein